MSSTPRSNPLTVRVGLLEGYDKVTFQMHGAYSMETLAGQALREPRTSSLRWRARIEESSKAQFLYSVLVKSFRKHEDAMSLAEEFEGRGVSATVRQIGGPIEIDGRVIGDNTLYRVQTGTFKSEEEAHDLVLSLEDEFAPRIVRETLRRGHGTIECFDEDLDESYSVTDGIRIIPVSPDARMTIYGVYTVTGFRYEKTENRDYAGVVEIYVDEAGELAALNEIPIDVYLRDVVPAEMPAGFPPEALKAQAILSRSVVMAEKSVKHLNDPFELCAHVHCQVYSGLTHEDERTNAAVDATRGMVLMQDGTLVEAHYAAVCGGHTEDANLTWMTPMMHPTRGVPCTCGGTVDIPDLSTESGVRKWIQSSPDVCCNLVDYELPVTTTYGRKHFRWEVSYTRHELEKILKEKTGENIGTLYDIIPIRRGRSGRLMEIEVLGSRKNFRIRRELKIRRALSHSALESSCFIVDVVHDSSGNPMEIVFTGAGWGHGVGLCQCGAARKAVQGADAAQIFEHYFPGITVEKLY
jgi:stage II sporulation protein D